MTPVSKKTGIAKKDDALDVLVGLYAKGQFAFSEDLLEQCYLIQKQYQFDKDRDLPVEHTRRLVEAEVTNLLAAGPRSSK